MRAGLAPRLALGLALCACGERASHGDASQEAEHREGAPTTASYAWLWANDTREDVVVRDPKTRWLSDDHGMRVRLQAWVDAIDAALRTAHPDALATIPKPIVLVADATFANASVRAVPIAWETNVRPATLRGEGKVARDFTLSRKGVVQPDAALPFLSRPHTPEHLGDLAKLLGDAGAKCRATVEAGALVFGDGCRFMSNAPSAPRFAFQATSRFLSITTAYVRLLGDEDLVVSTLAHELGHYYRAHQTLPVEATSYFYALADRDHATKPTPDPRFRAATERALDKMRSGWSDFAEENALMVEANLGFYTTEEEADELSLELLARVGIDPEVAVDKIFASWRTQKAPPDAGVVTMASCAALKERGFRDEGGAWVTVPVGNVDDAHHAYCFRAFNLARELDAHRYAVAPRAIPEDDAAFSALVSTLP